MHDGFLLHNHGSPGLGVIEKNLSHSFRQADATMGGRVGWDVPLVHRVAAPEKHSERHPRPIVMGARGSGILAHVDIRFHDVAAIIHIIAEHARDMIRVFPEDGVIPGWRAKPGLAGGNCGFANEILALVKVSPLLGDADDDFRRAGDAVAIPVARRGCRRSVSRGDGGNFGAACDQCERAKTEKDANGVGAGHLDAQINGFGLAFNLKDLAPPCQARQD
ncbi:MAG: hypothetical protein WAO00_06935 [Chthoniobacterales bacterium]